MIDRLQSLQVFVRICRTGNFSAAARALSLSQPSVSRIIASLEKEIGVPLLRRTTRGAVPTEAGEIYLARVEALIAGLEEADHEARGTGELRGTLRIACSATFAIKSVLPVLSPFTDAHPGLRVAFLLSDQRQDVIADGVDVALRVGVPPLQNSIQHRLGSNRRIVVASPDYLAKHAAPSVPGEMAHHPLIVGPTGQTSTEWLFRRDGQTCRVTLEPRFSLSSTEALIAAASGGLGLAVVGDLACRQEIASGLLLPLLSEWDLGMFEVRLVLIAGRSASPAARAFARFFRDAFSEQFDERSPETRRAS